MGLPGVTVRLEVPDCEVLVGTSGSEIYTEVPVSCIRKGSRSGERFVGPKSGSGPCFK